MFEANEMAKNESSSAFQASGLTCASIAIMMGLEDVLDVWYTFQERGPHIKATQLRLLIGRPTGQLQCEPTNL
jgi:hypothetical protein